MSRLRSLARRRSVTLQRALELQRRRYRLLWVGYRSPRQDVQQRPATAEAETTEHPSSRARAAEH